MPIKFTLQETMDRHNITQKALCEASGVRMNTILELRKGVAISINFGKLADLIIAINRITGENYGFEAVMEYTSDVEDSE